jgi:hypothetical protein
LLKKVKISGTHMLAVPIQHVFQVRKHAIAFTEKVISGKICMRQ